MQIADVKKIHYSICEDHQRQQPIIQLSYDGVQESKSSNTTLDIYSIKFNHCRSIYPIAIIRPCQKFKYDEKAELQKVLDDLYNNGLIIDSCVCDNPKRSFFRCAKCHSAKYACEYCFNCAICCVNVKKKTLEAIQRKFNKVESRLSQDIENLQQTQETENNQDIDEELENLTQLMSDAKKEKESELQKAGRKQLTWPASTAAGNLRTIENITAITIAIEDDPEILNNDPDFCKGIKGRSLFLNYPFFHMLKDITCEYMHLVCLSVVKRMVELTFKVGENRERVSKRKLTDPKMFNEMIVSIQLPRECSRRCRNLDFGVLKASEFRNFILFLFPLILDCIEDEFKDEKKIWLHLVFMVRACVIPNNEFRNVNSNHVESASENFYKLYEKCYGKINCTYSVHVVGGHILKIRGNRPLTHNSAFKFESFFSEMKNLFHAGTLSTPKQILQNTFVKRTLEHHVCEKTPFYCPEKQTKPGKKFIPGKENNHLVYTFNENNVTTMYSIESKLNNDQYRCKIQGKFPMKTPLTPNYDWSTVGVFRAGPLSEDCEILSQSDICGKVIKVNKFLITCPLNVLVEQ